MKKIILSILISLFFLPYSFAWWSGYSKVDTSATFNKKHWKQELYVFEEYFINPFANSTITKNTSKCTGNACPCWSSGCSYTTSYRVNGKIFNPNHPKFINAHTTKRKWWKIDNGLSARTVYIENTYRKENGVYVPRQEVKVRKYYKATYKHDTTAPTCGTVKYYDDEALTQEYNYMGGWLNSPKYYTMVCADPESWCYCADTDNSCQKKWWVVISIPQLIGHKTAPEVSFTNTVNLTNPACKPWINQYKEVLYDEKNPTTSIQIGEDDIPVNFDTNRDYDVVDGKKQDWIEQDGTVSFTYNRPVTFLAGDYSMNLTLTDIFTPHSTHGVAWIQSYTFDVFRQTDTSHRELSEWSVKVDACSENQSYPPYNAKGNIETDDKKNILLTCNDVTRISGKYLIKIVVKDWAWNITTVKIPLTIYPNDIALPNSSLTLLEWTRDNLYANKRDEYVYELTLKDQYDNPIFGKILSSLEQNISGYNNGKFIPLTLGWNSNALAYNPDTNITLDREGITTFAISSYAPWEFTERFKLNYKPWGRNYVQNQTAKNIFITTTQDNSFKQPFVATLSVTGPWDVPEIGTLQGYNIELSNVGNIAGYANGRLDIRSATLPFMSGHYFDTFSNVSNTFTSSDLICEFTGKINSSTANSVLETPKMSSNNMKISYTLQWENVNYILNEFWLEGCDVDTLGLKVIGNIQWDGKSNITGQKNNFSDLTLSTLRSDIRQNAYNIIRSMSSNSIVNGVRYVEGDIELSKTPTNYETLIVKNGNVFISGNLNGESKFGIIVLQDASYSLESDYNKKGNIYVKNTVSNINAALYADGALRSARSNWVSYNDNEIRNSLNIFWVLFTRNTVGGAVDAGLGLTLPGGGKTTDQELAAIYDLNYIRKANLCGDDAYSLKIEYNPKIQTNPPKWFSF
jgi:hypothetical protein